jgi:hypothetical protein
VCVAATLLLLLLLFSAILVVALCGGGSFLEHGAFARGRLALVGARGAHLDA